MFVHAGIYSIPNKSLDLLASIGFRLQLHGESRSAKRTFLPCLGISVFVPPIYIFTSLQVYIVKTFSVPIHQYEVLFWLMRTEDEST